MKFKTKIMQHFNIAEPGFYQGRAFDRVAEDVREAIDDDLFLAIVGNPGSGKKTIVSKVVRDLTEENKASSRPHHIIYLKINDDTKITIAQVVNEMILELSFEAEAPKRDFYARKRQLAALLGRAVVRQKGKVTLIIEQAQHLHGNTIRALKELREINFLDQMELFGIILTGHFSLKGKIEMIEDVAPRVEIDALDEASGWMTETERLQYLKQRWGDCLNETMREQIVTHYKTPLALDVVVYNKMKDVYRRGDSAFGERDFLPLKVLLEQHPVSYQKIAESTPNKVSKSTVARIVNGDTGSFDPATISEVENTVADLIGKMTDLKKTA